MKSRTTNQSYKSARYQLNEAMKMIYHHPKVQTRRSKASSTTFIAI